MDDLEKAIARAERAVLIRRTVPPECRLKLEDLAQQFRTLCRDFGVEARVHSREGFDAAISAYIPGADIPVWTRILR